MTNTATESQTRLALDAAREGRFGDALRHWRTTETVAGLCAGVGRTGAACARGLLAARLLFFSLRHRDAGYEEAARALSRRPGDGGGLRPGAGGAVDGKPGATPVRPAG